MTDEIANLIQQQSKMIADLTAELTAYREQADKPEDIAELARQVVRYAGVFKELREAKRMLADIAAERNRLLAFVDWVAAYPCPSEIQTICAFKNCEKCIRTQAREASGRT